MSLRYKRSISETGTADPLLNMEPEREPIVFNTENMDPDDLRLLEPCLKTAAEVLWHWKTFPIVLPPPISNKGEQINSGTSTASRKKTLNLKDLFIEPDFDEMELMAMDSRGHRRRLNHEQLESIRQTGEFEIDSFQFPGQKHRWILTQLLIKGKRKVLESMHKDLAKALYLLYVTAKGRLTGVTFSLLQGLNGWSAGLMNVLDIFFGVPLLQTVGLESKLHEERSRFLVAELKCPLRDCMAQLCSYLEWLSQHESHLDPNGKAPVIPYQFQTPKGMDVDLRLCSREVMSSAKPYLLHILNAALKGWIQEKRKVVISDLKCKQLPDKEIEVLTNEVIAKEYLNRVCELIKADSGIQSIGSGITDLFIDQIRTYELIKDVLEDEAKDITDHKQRVEKYLTKHYPILSRVRPWLKDRLHLAHKKHVHEHCWEAHENAIAKCQDRKLEVSAYFLSRDLLFRKNHEPILRKELKKHLKEPTRSFEFKTRIWFPRNWIVREQKQSGDPFLVIPTVISKTDPEVYRPSSLNLNNEKTYNIVKTNSTTNSTRYFFWRWSNFFLRTWSWFWNILFFLGIVVPWCSSVSLRALSYANAFFPDYEVDPRDGSLRKSRSSKTHTVLSRLSALWRHVSESRKTFEAQPDTGLLSKSLMRHTNRFYNYILKGFFGTTFIVVCLPITFLCLSLLSLVAAVTSPVWVWTGSAVLHLLMLLFYDIDGATPITALVWNVVFVVFGLGVVQPLLALFVSCLVCPVMSVLIMAYAVTRKGLRDAWDALIFQVLIKKRARVPSHNSFLSRRIAGPGMASQYYYQIRTEQALVALEAKMEMDQLMAFKAESEREIQKPKLEYCSFISKLLGPFGVAPCKKANSPFKALDDECSGLLNNLQDRVAKRVKQLELQTPKVVRQKIRLTEKDLKLVLMQGVRQVEDFYPKNVLARLDENDREEFWENRQLEEGDWLGLTSFLLSEVFSNEFLTPLQAEDTSFQLKVTNWNLNRYVTMALEGQWRDDLDFARVIQSPKTSMYIRHPEIPLEAFNPMVYHIPSGFFTHKRGVFQLRWKVVKRSKTDLSSKLTNPVPVPHPIVISVIIYNRESSHNLNIRSLELNNTIKFVQDLPQPSISEARRPSPSPSNTLQSVSRADSMYEMDPAMASLTQSLEELDRDVDRPVRKKLGSPRRPVPSSQDSKTSSMPLLASTEDISVAKDEKADVNPESYSTEV